MMNDDEDLYQAIDQAMRFFVYVAAAVVAGVLAFAVIVEWL